MVKHGHPGDGAPEVRQGDYEAGSMRILLVVQDR
jgi:hypothetical protein